MFTQRSVTGINDNTMVYKACFNQDTVCVTYRSACFWECQYYLPVCRQIHTLMSDLKTRVFIMKNYLQTDHKSPDLTLMVSVAEAVEVTVTFKYSVHVFHDKDQRNKRIIQEKGRRK